CLTTKAAFFLWALDDVRYIDHLIWQHIAPRLYPELHASLDEVRDKTKASSEERADAIHRVLDKFVHKQLSGPPFNGRQWRVWLTTKLEKLREYDTELASLGKQT